MDIIDISERGLTFLSDATVGWPSLFALGFMGVALIAVLIRVFSDRGWSEILPRPEGPKAIYVLAGILSPVWLCLLFVVLFTLFRIVVSFPEFGGLAQEGSDPGAALRWHVLALVGLLTALGGLVGLPFALVRVQATERQTVATEQGLVTDRINAAVASLGAEKEVNRIGRSLSYKLDGRWHTEFEWQDERLEFPEGAEFPEDAKPAAWKNVALTVPNMEVRVGAILALGRIARENLPFHVQIMQILCAYVRENAPAHSAVPFEPPEFPVKEKGDHLTSEDIKTYKEELEKRLKDLRAAMPKPRTDIQTALDVLGRRNPAQKRKEGAWPDPDGSAPNIFDTPFPKPPPYPNAWSADDHAGWKKAFDNYRKQSNELRDLFSKTRCYRFDLRKTNLQGCDMRGLDLRGALFEGAQLQGARLTMAQLQGANLKEAWMQGAFLGGAQMQGAVLGSAQMQGARLRSAQMQGADLREARMPRAEIGYAGMQGANFGEAQMQRAMLVGARMQGADLAKAQMQRAILRKVQMQGAVLRGARMQGADLGEVRMSEDRNLAAATLRGAAVRSVDRATTTCLRDHWEVIFADVTVKVPDGERPAHWSNEELAYRPRDPDNSPFHVAWREWQATLPPEEGE